MKSLLRSRGVAVLAALLFTHSPFGAVRVARATLLNWNNVAGGSAAVAGNWNPAQVPVAADVLTWALNNTYTTSFNASTTASSQMHFRDGTVTISFSSPHTVSAAFQIATFAADTASVTLNTGTLTSNGNAFLGTAQPCSGSLHVNSASALFAIGGSTSDLAVGNIGHGSLDVTNGATVTSGDDVFIGNQATSTGICTVAGRSITPLQSSTLTTTSATGDIYVANAGYGELHVNAFGLVTCGGNLYVAPFDHAGFDGNGILTVGDAATGGATLVANHDLWIGGGFGGSGGNGTVDIAKNGKVNVAGVTHLGNNTNVGGATLHLDTGSVPSATFRTGSLAIDNNATFDFQGGFVTVDGGALTTDGEALTIDAPGSLIGGPRLALTNGATASLPSVSSTSMTLGVDDYGDARADSGATWTLAGDLVMGQNAGSSSLLQLSNGSSLSANALKVGIDGAAQVTVSGASTVSASSSLQLGTNGSGSGSGLMGVSGAGTVVTLNAGARIGRNVSAPSPVSVLTISNSGAVDVTLSVTSFVNANGGLSIQSSGQMSMPGSLSVSGGLVDMTGGLLTADSLLVSQTGGRVNGTGTITAKTLNNGTVAPGHSAGKLTIASTYAQTSTGHLTMELGNHATSELDTLAVTQSASLGGTLDLVRLPTFAASVGDQYRIMTFASRTGTFANVTLDGGPATGVTVIYNATNVTVQISGATGIGDLAAMSSVPATISLSGRRTAGGAGLTLALPQDADVRVALYDVAGREVAELREGHEGAGVHAYRVASSVPSGVYFGRAVVTARGAREVATARVTLVR